MKIYIDVAIALPLNGPFTYSVAAADVSRVRVGCRVLVPFKNRDMIGYIVGVNTTTDVCASQVKDIRGILDAEPVLDTTMLALCDFVRARYLCSYGEALANALPIYLKNKKKGMRDIVLRKNTGEPFPDVPDRASVVLTGEQADALHLITESMKGRPQKFLLHGVTGSGKTEVYVRAIMQALSIGKTAICLFPEIALTKHLQAYFIAHFGDAVALVHSHLTQSEQFRTWRAIFDGEKKVVLGPRSALFTPLKNVGLIIIDEEHENTYKQNEVPRYHARTVACERARLEGCVVVAGGATPSLETMYRSVAGDWQRLRLSNRIDNRPMPKVTVVDMKHEMWQSKIVLISMYLKNEIENAVARKEGVLLFLNRRGFATSIMCLQCGDVLKCEQCRVPLTYHQSKKKLVCHYCDKQMSMPQGCPACNHPKLRLRGVGTEKVESHISRLFPHARVARFDTDSVQKKGMHEKILEKFEKREIDILVGTQMITKGFDFPHVSLVGVINADTVLSLPDFRSSERTFQLLMQVAGRAGRGDIPGKVIVQTFSPNNYAIQSVVAHNFEAFYEKEIAFREELRYPPFADLVNIIIRGEKEQSVSAFADKVSHELQPIIKKYGCEVLGPAPLPFTYLRGYYRWHVMLKGKVDSGLLEELREKVVLLRKHTRSCQLQCDVEPAQIL